MHNIFHSLSSEELEEAIIEYLAGNKGRHDLVTSMLYNACHYTISKNGELIISQKGEKLKKSP